MLKGIPSIISPELLKVLDEMGHGDEIVLADGNFPGESIAANTVYGKAIREDGHGVCELLEGILKVFPLDTYDQSVYIMERVPGDTVPGHEVPVPIWDEFERIIKPYAEEGDGERGEGEQGEVEHTTAPSKTAPSTTDLRPIERFAFYERAKKAYAVVQTGEGAQYANIILKKGVVVSQR